MKIYRIGFYALLLISAALGVMLFLQYKKVNECREEIVLRDNTILENSDKIEELKEEEYETDLSIQEYKNKIEELNNEINRRRRINRTLKDRTVKYEYVLSIVAADSILAKYSITPAPNRDRWERDTFD